MPKQKISPTYNFYFFIIEFFFKCSKGSLRNPFFPHSKSKAKGKNVSWSSRQELVTYAECDISYSTYFNVGKKTILYLYERKDKYSVISVLFLFPPFFGPISRGKNGFLCKKKTYIEA